MHAHSGVIFGLAVAATMVIVFAGARTIAAYNADKPWGQALAFVL